MKDIKKSNSYQYLYWKEDKSSSSSEDEKDGKKLKRKELKKMVE